jgi:proteasome lid subunit RPN8/RPN11
MSGPLKVAAAVSGAMQRHGAETYPDECCGALIAVGGVVVEALPLPNTTDAGAARRFTIAPEGYKLAEDRARAQRGALAGFYHSHPDEAARPSRYDLEHAWPNLAYVIISVRRGVPADSTVWYLRDDRTDFDEGELIWVTGS